MHQSLPGITCINLISWMIHCILTRINLNSMYHLSAISKKVKTIVLFCLTLGFLTSCGDKSQERESTAIKVEVREDNGRYTLYRGGEPYQVKGAGLEFGSVTDLWVHGGNSFRTWRTENGVKSGQEVLDEAHKYGITVSMCLEVSRERHGFDYDDEEDVRRQFDMLKEEVLKYRDHPALLTWIIGNELNLESENPKVWDAVNDLSKMVHDLDPNHPTTTTLAGFNKELGKLVNERASDLDFISIQMYGDIVNLPRYLEEANYTGPIMVTEWGATGHWEVNKTSWGAPIEQHSTTKAKNYMGRYHTVIKPNIDQIIGDYVFLWEQKQERTPTWYGMFLANGEKTETIDVMHYIWKGEWPANQAPAVEYFKVNGQEAQDDVKLSPGQSYSAEVKIMDKEDDAIQYLWDIKQESDATQTGGDYEETPESIENLLPENQEATIQFKAPVTTGAYRIFVYASDGNGKSAHANIPFLVE